MPGKMLLKAFTGHKGNPLALLADALNGLKFGSDVKLEDEMLDKLNRAIAVNKLFETENGRYNGGKINKDFSKVFGEYEPQSTRDWEKLVDGKSFYDFARELHEELPNDYTPMDYWSAQYSYSPNWVDVARNDPEIKKYCFENNNPDLCKKNLGFWMNDNITTEGAIPLLEDIANYRARERMENFRKFIVDENSKLSRINVKKPQDFAKSFAFASGVDVNTAKNDAQHRINIAWRDYQNRILKIAEREGVFLDPLMYTEDPVYGEIARSYVNGDPIERYTLETIPEIPSNGINYKGSRYWGDRPNYNRIVDRFSNRGYCWSPFKNAVVKGIVER